MADSFFKVKKGIRIEPNTTAASEAGDMRVDSAAANALKYYDSAERTVVNTDGTQTITGKTLTGNIAVNLVSGAATVTLPTVTGTLATLAGTEVLTNKTLTGNIAVNLVSGAATVTLPTTTSTLATLALAETLTNKTLTAPVINGGAYNGGTASALNKLVVPSDTLTNLNALGHNEGRIVYATDTDKLYTDNGTTLNEISGGGSGGSKNYLTVYNSNTGNGDFELSSTGDTTVTGWSKFNTTLTSLIPTGAISAGASSLDTYIVVGGGAQLAATKSLKVGNTAGTITAGHGFISSAFTIDIEDYAKPMSVSFSYKVNTGASLMNFSGTSANTWQVYIYDTTASAWIQPAGVYNMVQSTLTGKVAASFQTDSASTQYRLAVVCINANSSGATDIIFDSFSVGPDKQIVGAPVTDWTAFTPTGSWTSNSTYTGYYRRVGDSLEAKVRVALSGAPNATSFTTTLPFGLTIDTNKYFNDGGDRTVGLIAIEDGATKFFGRALPSSTTAVGGAVGRGDATFVESSGITETVPVVFANGNVVHINYSVPILGWASSVSLSNDTDTRVVAARYTNSAGATLTKAAANIVTFPTKVYDTHGAFASTIFTVPVSGKYRVTSNMFLDTGASWVASDFLSLTIQKNSVAYSLAYSIQQSTHTTYVSCLITGEVDCLAGDTLRIAARPEKASAGNVSQVADANAVWIEFERLSGPATIAASEKVFLQYTSNANGTPTANVTNVDWTTKVVDSHGAWNGTQFTAPRPGFYIAVGSVNFTTQRDTLVQAYINAVAKTFNGYSDGTGSGNHDFSAAVYLNAGDILSFRIQNSYQLSSTTSSHWISIYSQG